MLFIEFYDMKLKTTFSKLNKNETRSRTIVFRNISTFQDQNTVQKRVKI